MNRSSYRAARGDERSATSQSERARRPPRRHGPPGDLNEDSAASWIGIGAFNHAKLRSYYGLCYVLLDKPKRALEELTRSLDALDPALKKHRCTALADQATALIQLGEIEEGCQRASESLAMAIELCHAANADRTRKLRPRLEPWKDHPAVRVLDEQLRVVARW